MTLSALNFRDLGGLPAAGGRKVRTRMLFRSEGPASFLDHHREELGTFGFRTICDLRSDGERERAPNDWCGPGCELLDLAMNNDVRADSEWRTELERDGSAENGRRVIATGYADMPATLLEHLPRIVDALLAGQVPMMIHCTAGKDRTGVTVGVLLALLGVPRDVILADYAKSEIFGANLRKAGKIDHGFLSIFGFVPSEPVVEMLIGAEPFFLESALDAVDSRWGGVSAYFSAAGIDAARQGELRAALLEPA